MLSCELIHYFLKQMCTMHTACILINYTFISNYVSLKFLNVNL